MELMKLDQNEEVPEAAVKAAAYCSGLEMIAKVIVGYCLLQGISIIVGGEERFRASAYTYALDAPGAPTSWGAFLIIVGICIWISLSLRHISSAAFGFALAGLWSTFFAIAFLRAAFEIPDANLTAMWVYGKDAIIFLTVGVTLYSSTYRNGHRR